jgi:hypothetical protein
MLRKLEGQELDSYTGSQQAVGENSMATPLDPKQIISFEELLMSQVVQQEALTRLLIEKGLFSKEEFLEMVSKV